MARILGTTGPLPDGFAGDLLGQQARSVLLAVLAAGLGSAVSNLARGTGGRSGCSATTPPRWCSTAVSRST